jgi:pachytene checkpoint protein 2
MMMSDDFLESVVIEVHVRSNSLLPMDTIRSNVITYLKESFPVFRDTIIDFSTYSNRFTDDESQHISKYVRSLRICDIGNDKSISFWKANLMIHCYRCRETGPEREYIDGKDDDDLPSTEQWELPNEHLEGLWESIIVDDNIKQNLLGYTTSSLLFSLKDINPTVIAWNRMLLLYGPPGKSKALYSPYRFKYPLKMKLSFIGTGKTTICKALAHKIAIRQQICYDDAVLVEINSHSLFSKWFSESGKLVMKLFDHILELAEDKRCLVIVLIDEVESITVSRKPTSNEPGDAIRVVNAVLTSLDSLKRLNNVLVLSTSNLIDSIDPVSHQQRHHFSHADSRLSLSSRHSKTD